MKSHLAQSDLGEHPGELHLDPTGHALRLCEEARGWSVEKNRAAHAEVEPGVRERASETDNNKSSVGHTALRPMCMQKGRSCGDLTCRSTYGPQQQPTGSMRSKSARTATSCDTNQQRNHGPHLVVDIVSAAEVVEREVESLLCFPGVPRHLRRCRPSSQQQYASPSSKSDKIVTPLQGMAKDAIIERRNKKKRTTKDPDGCARALQGAT